MSRSVVDADVLGPLSSYNAFAVRRRTGSRALPRPITLVDLLLGDAGRVVEPAAASSNPGNVPSPRSTRRGKVLDDEPADRRLDRQDRVLTQIFAVEDLLTAAVDDLAPARFITSSYLSTFLRISKLRSSTVPWRALDRARETIFDSSGHVVGKRRVHDPRHEARREEAHQPRPRVTGKKRLSTVVRPAGPDRPRSWLSMRRDSWRSVAEHIETAEGNDLLALGVALGLEAGEELRVTGIELGGTEGEPFLHALADERGPLGGYRPAGCPHPRPAMLVATVHRLELAGLDDDLGFPLVLLSRSAPRAGCPSSATRATASPTSRPKIVPTSTGWPLSYRSLMSSIAARELRILGSCRCSRRGRRRTISRFRGDRDHLQVCTCAPNSPASVDAVTRHAAELLVQTEVVLEGDRREGLVLLFDLHGLFGLDRLVQPFAPAAALEDAGR